MPFRGGDGDARQHHNHLPHVTPSPRVPALPASRSASFAIMRYSTGFQRERAGPRDDGHHLPHVTPSPRVPALPRFGGPPLSFGKIPGRFSREGRDGSAWAAICLTSPLPPEYSTQPTRPCCRAPLLSDSPRLPAAWFCGWAFSRIKRRLACPPPLGRTVVAAVFGVRIRIKRD